MKFVAVGTVCCISVDESELGILGNGKPLEASIGGLTMRIYRGKTPEQLAALAEGKSEPKIERMETGTPKEQGKPSEPPSLIQRELLPMSLESERAIETTLKCPDACGGKLNAYRSRKFLIFACGTCHAVAGQGVLVKVEDDALLPA